MKKYLRLSALLLIVSLTVFGAGWFALSSLPMSVGYCMETEFETIPTDDVALESWLKLQPVVAHTVFITRETKGNRTRIKITFIQVQSFVHGHKSPLPNLDEHCERLGYRGASHPFRDSPRE